MSIEIGQIIEGKITGITAFGAFVSLGDNKSGMVHISEVSSEFVRDIHDCLKEGQTVRVMVTGIDANGRIALSIKRVRQSEQARNAQSASSFERVTAPPEEFVPLGRRKEAGYESFEDMMKKFKADSTAKQNDINRSALSKRSGGYPNPRSQRKTK